MHEAPIRCQLLVMRLMRLNSTVEHVPGKLLVVADALFLQPLPSTVEPRSELYAESFPVLQR